MEYNEIKVTKDHKKMSHEKLEFENFIYQYTYMHLHSGSKASISFLSPWAFETIAKTLLYTLPELK